jgi:uncharacterized protein DUF2795
MERGSDKHGPRVDEQLAHEVTGLTAAGRSTHAEEWKDPEPPGEDQPDVDREPDGTLVGGTPPGLSPDEVELRSEVAAALGKEVWPATGTALVARARGNNAADRVLELLTRLRPEQRYVNLQDAWSSLGGGGEEQRF